MQNVMTYIAYTAGALFMLLGLAILFNILHMNQLTSQLRVMMGIVLFLYGTFRIVSTIFKKRPKDEKQETE